MRARMPLAAEVEMASIGFRDDYMQPAGRMKEFG